MANAEIVVAELVEPAPATHFIGPEVVQAEPLTDSSHAAPVTETFADGVDDEHEAHRTAGNTSSRSWVFRCGDAIGTFTSHLFGIASVIMLLAVTASIPIVQFLSFGYLLEVSGRLARGEKLRDAMVGLRKATVVGGIVLGIWLCLFPIRIVSQLWFDAYLIDPLSNQTSTIRFFQVALVVLTLAHIAAALICGGKLRYFFWPLVAPVSFSIWALRRLAGSILFRRILNFFCGWISPSLADDICSAKPIGDWFLPAIVWKRIRQGNLYVELRDRMWNFVNSLRPGYYFSLGAKGFFGSLMWLFLPTSLLVISSFVEGAAAGVTFIFGLLFAIPIFAGLPFIQAHFARDGKFRNFFEPWRVYKNFGRAPIAHVIALLLMLILALPLFLLKIESIPSELLWTLSLVFVVFSWPAKVAVGLAYRRANRKENKSWWFIRYPMVLATFPISFAFVMIFVGTRYVSWHGALSLFENHVFLLPAPFWL